MRKLLFGFVAVALFAPFAPAADPKAIVEKAIEAHGGRKMLEKYPAAKVSFTGEMAIMGQNATVSGVNTTDKGKVKIELDIAIAGQKIKVLQMATADKSLVQITVGGMKVDAPVTEGQKEELKLSTNYSDITTLVPLLDDKRFELKSEDDGEVEKKKADVVSVKIKSVDRSVKLYFDKETKLLMMMEREGLVPGSQEDKKGKLTTIFGEFKKVDGVQVPMKFTSKVDGELFLTATVTEHVNLEKTDAKEFAIDD
jgi:hypothetical protein